MARGSQSILDALENSSSTTHIFINHKLTFRICCSPCLFCSSSAMVNKFRFSCGCQDITSPFPTVSGLRKIPSPTCVQTGSPTEEEEKACNFVFHLRYSPNICLTHGMARILNMLQQHFGFWDERI